MKPRPRLPLFYRTVYDEEALDDCFHDLIHAKMPDQDKIEVGCLIQYCMLLKTHGLMSLPIDITKHRQGEGPDFTVCSGDDGLYGVEMTKVTTADYQVWLKRRMTYRPIRDVNDYMGYRPEQRVSALAGIRVLRKNYKIENYYASVPDMQQCDLVLEEDGDTAMNENVLMQLMQAEMKKLRIQRYGRISMISGSVLYYAINTPEAQILYAPEIRPNWLKPQRGMLTSPPTLSWH
jgi:hypothetical protein